MRVLIMVLTYNKDVFYDFMKAQQTTWDSIGHENIDVIYYYGNEGEYNFRLDEFQVECSDDYEMMHWKFKLALDKIDYHNYNFVFRTNSCSYIDKHKLFNFAKTLPQEKCYAGWDNEVYVSGAGIFFSPDVLDIVMAELTDTPHGAEDVLIGQILSGKAPMLKDNSRIDARVEGIDFENIPNNTYHFRFKTTNDLDERIRDVENMYSLHNFLNK